MCRVRPLCVWRTSASLASPTCSLSASAMGRSGKLKSQWNPKPRTSGTSPFSRGWLSQAQDYSNWKRHIKLHKNLIQKSKLPTPLHNKAGVELLVVWAWVLSISLSHFLSSPIYALRWPLWPCRGLHWHTFARGLGEWASQSFSLWLLCLDHCHRWWWAESSFTKVSLVYLMSASGAIGSLTAFKLQVFFSSPLRQSHFSHSFLPFASGSFFALGMLQGVPVGIVRFSPC